MTHCQLPLVGSLTLTQQPARFSYPNHAWQMLEEVRALCASARFYLALDAAGLTRQTSNLHPCWLAPFQRNLLLYSSPLYNHWHWVVESQRPMQNQGCQSQWKSHLFRLLRTFVHLKRCTVSSIFPSPGPFFSLYLGREGSGVVACWGMAAPTSGFKEEQDRTCVMRCDDSFIHFLPGMHGANPEGSGGGCMCSLTDLTATESRPGHSVLWRSGGHTSSCMLFEAQTALMQNY